MTFGFSYVGLIFLILLFVPNLIWTKNRPKDYDQYACNENKILLGVYGKSLLLLAATGILGIGHIGIHLNHRKEIR